MKTLDFRSDTVTRPTAEMREAIACAEVGDDVYGEDPSINRLQEMAAEITGKRAAILVPSGTMANQVAIHALTSPGDVVLAGENAHILRYEAGAAAALSGVQIQTIGADGFFGAEEVSAAIPFDDVHCAPATLLALENTHNVSGGRVFPQRQVEAATALARDRGLSTHLDGARLFNAAIASDLSPATLAAPFDSVAFCLSKGLGCPVGSMVCGDEDLVERVHRVRKMLGGGMRQAGVLAAAGIYALEKHVERLAVDHSNARRLAKGLEDMGIEVPASPQTNMVVFAVEEAPRFLQSSRESGVLMGDLGAHRIRAVTHLDLSEADIDDTLDRLRSLR